MFIAGPSKSLTFEEGVGTLAEGDATATEDDGKKLPDPCCPLLCERMWVYIQSHSYNFYFSTRYSFIPVWKLILIHKYIFIFFRFSCCCECFSESCIGKSWAGFRLFVFNIVDNPFFEWTILLLIFASSLSLCFEDINLQDNEEVSL